MRAVLNFLLSRWTLSFVGVAILALLVWFFGPLVELLEGWLARLVVILVLALLWAVSNLSIDLYRRRRERKLENSVAEQVQVAVDDGTGEEAAAVKERTSKALGLLKKARGTRGSLYRCTNSRRSCRVSYTAT